MPSSKQLMSNSRPLLQLRGQLRGERCGSVRVHEQAARACCLRATGGAVVVRCGGVSRSPRVEDPDGLVARRGARRVRRVPARAPGCVPQCFALRRPPLCDDELCQQQGARDRQVPRRPHFLFSPGAFHSDHLPVPPLHGTPDGNSAARLLPANPATLEAGSVRAGRRTAVMLSFCVT